MVQPGLPVDAGGGPAVDPTANVLALVKAAERRQDDLREADTRHFGQVLDMMMTHFAELRTAEAARLDANRVVDNTAVTRAAEVAQAAASTLATVVATSAETLRAQVAATAAAQTAALESALAPIRADIASLKQVQYEASGAKASTREGLGDRRSSVGMVVGVVGLAASILFAVLAFLA